MRCAALILFLSACMSGCSVIAVADAAVTVVATTVSVGATVVGAAVDVTAAGVRAVAGSDDDEGVDERSAELPMADSVESPAPVSAASH